MPGVMLDPRCHTTVPRSILVTVTVRSCTGGAVSSVFAESARSDFMYDLNERLRRASALDRAQVPQRAVGTGDGVGEGAGWGVIARKVAAISSSQPLGSCDGSDDTGGISTYIRAFAGIT